MSWACLNPCPLSASSPLPLVWPLPTFADWPPAAGFLPLPLCSMEPSLSCTRASPGSSGLSTLLSLSPLSSFLVGSGLPHPTRGHFQAQLCQHPRPGPQRASLSPSPGLGGPWHVHTDPLFLVKGCLTAVKATRPWRSRNRRHCIPPAVVKPLLQMWPISESKSGISVCPLTR